MYTLHCSKKTIMLMLITFVCVRFDHFIECPVANRTRDVFFQGPDL